MGCFVSTSNSDKESSPTNTRSSRAPLPSQLIEEETVVKEVLSETPSQSKPPISRFSPNLTSPKNQTFPSPNRRLQIPHQQNGGVFKNPQSGELSEDAYENCSSLSESCDGNNLADGYDDVTKIQNGSPGKFRNRQLSRDGLVGNSPGRRSGPSPSRSRSGPSQVRVRPRTGRDADGMGNVKSMGSEMGHGRRSTSPATRVDSTTRSISGPSRSSSGRRLMQGRVGSTELIDQARMDDNNYYRNNEAKLAPTNTESLENPLVSLECFIFL